MPSEILFCQQLSMQILSYQVSEIIEFLLILLSNISKIWLEGSHLKKGQLKQKHLSLDKVRYTIYNVLQDLIKILLLLNNNPF